MRGKLKEAQGLHGLYFRFINANTSIIGRKTCEEDVTSVCGNAGVQVLL